MRISSSASFVDNNNGGITNFKGMVRVDSLASWTTTAVNDPARLIFEGGIISVAGPTATFFNAGAATFAASQNLFSRTFMNFANNVVVGVGAVINSQALVRITGTLDVLMRLLLSDKTDGASITSLLTHLEHPIPKRQAVY